MATKCILHLSIIYSFNSNNCCRFLKCGLCTFDAAHVNNSNLDLIVQKCFISKCNNSYYFYCYYYGHTNASVHRFALTKTKALLFYERATTISIDKLDLCVSHETDSQLVNSIAISRVKRKNCLASDQSSNSNSYSIRDKNNDSITCINHYTTTGV